MADWIKIIFNLKYEKASEYDFVSSAHFSDIEKWLKFNHPIEEIFQNKDAYNDIVKKELIKLERRKKLEKINDRREEDDNR